MTVDIVQSAFWQTNTGIITDDNDDADGGVLLIDPGVFPDELRGLAERLGQGRVIAALATHEDWDHVLWSDVLGAEVPRYADAAVAAVLERDRDALLQSITNAESEFGVRWDHDEIGRHIPLPGDDVVFGDGGTGIRLQVIPTPGHTPVHTSFWLPDEGVLFAGDLLSDIDIPMLAEMPDAVSLYLATLERIEPILQLAGLVVPGHGMPCRRAEALHRLAQDRHYLHALAQGFYGADLTGDDRRQRDTNREAHDRNLGIAGAFP